VSAKLVIGANGFLGSHVTRQLVSDGHEVRAMVRPNAMTVEWTNYAQSLTDRPVKGMLTGPVTMLMWSFVRDDQPRSETCTQLALAIRDEVSDLEAAGVDIIQVDEPAIREGLPLRSDRWDEYLDWAVYTFRLSVSPGHRGALDVYVPLVDWGARFEAIRAPIRIRVDLQTIDRTVAQQLAEGKELDVQQVRTEARDALAAYPKRLIPTNSISDRKRVFLQPVESFGPTFARMNVRGVGEVSAALELHRFRLLD